MAFNPFNEEKTKELRKTFRQQYQELIKRNEAEEDEELNPALQYINEMNDHANYLDDMERYEEKQLNRHARANGCGHKRYRTETNGQPGCIVWECGDHRLCPRCRKKRAEELINALKYHDNGLDIGQFLRIKEIHEAEYDMYSKRAQREKNRLINGREIKFKYGKINQPDHRIFLFSNGESDEWGEELIDYDWGEYGQINWNEVIEQIPMGKNISGSIWIKPEATGSEEEDGEGEGEEEIEKVMIPTLNFNTNATKREIDLAYYEAAAETQVIVTSIEELQKALFGRTRIWQEKIGKEKCGEWMDFTLQVSELDIEAWNKSIVSSNHIENSNIDKVDSRSTKEAIKELTPVEQLALVE